MLKQVQNQKLGQSLSPQRIMLMKLLQVPTMELNGRIQDELMDNPALEVDSGEDDSTDELSSLEDTEYENGLEDEKFENDNFEEIYDDDNYNYYSGNLDEENNKKPNIRAEKTFHDHLTNQLDLLKLNEKEKTIGKQIIGSIDDDGFLRREPSAIKNDLYFSKNIEVSIDEIVEILKQIQGFDPIGVGARDLQETLLIQLEHHPNKESENYLKAHKALDKYFNQFVKKQYKALMTKLKVSEDELRDIIDIITSLNPKPGSYYANTGGTAPSYNIIPDFFVKNEGGKLNLTLNSRNAPTLKISDQFRQIIKTIQEGGKLNKKQKETVSFAKHKIEYANWFIDSIKQRQETLLKTMTAILQLQEEFFLSGDWMNLKPMILKDVAEKIDMDISTVSRVVNQKYVETEHGLFRLKEFFSESMINSDGEEISNLNIKMTIEEIINEEDKSKPLSDLQLQKALNARGYKLARRTVSKYREQLNFPVARLRKEL